MIEWVMSVAFWVQQRPKKKLDFLNNLNEYNRNIVF